MLKVYDSTQVGLMMEKEMVCEYRVRLRKMGLDQTPNMFKVAFASVVATVLDTEKHEAASPLWQGLFRQGIILYE